jgi:phenylacetate-CoA ligase
LLVSGDSLTPFLLYDIGDRGRVFTYNELLAELGEVGPVVKAQLQRQGLPHTELPFVFVFERADLSTSIYGLQIYPQHIKIALEKMVSTRVLTGKFVLTTKRDRRQNQYLELRAELQTSARASAKLKTNIAHAVLRTLHEINSEFRELSKYVPASRLRPKILLSKNGDAKFFPIGIKQKWVV